MINLGVIVATYPQGNSVDVVMIKDGNRLANVQVMSWTGSSNTGIVDLPDIGANPATRWDVTQPVTRYVRGIIGFITGIPICIGFLPPQITEMTFARTNFKIDRHASDVYSTINSTGDMETYHPSGTYFRIGASPAHEDLTQHDIDQLWAIKNNTGAAVHVHLAVANAGSVVATVDIDPEGNINVIHNGNLTSNTGGNLSATIKGNLTATVSGTTSVNSSGNMELTAPQITLNGITTINGATTVNGSVQGNGTLATTGKATLAQLQVL